MYKPKKSRFRRRIPKSLSFLRQSRLTCPCSNHPVPPFRIFLTPIGTLNLLLLAEFMVMQRRCVAQQRPHVLIAACLFLALPPERLKQWGSNCNHTQRPIQFLIRRRAMDLSPVYASILSCFMLFISICCSYRSHTGCNKEFNRPDKLKAHILSHSGKCKNDAPAPNKVDSFTTVPQKTFFVVLILVFFCFVFCQVKTESVFLCLSHPKPCKL